MGSQEVSHPECGWWCLGQRKPSLSISLTAICWFVFFFFYKEVSCDSCMSPTSSQLWDHWWERERQSQRASAFRMLKLSRKCPWGDSEKQANSLEINCFTQWQVIRRKWNRAGGNHRASKSGVPWICNGDRRQSPWIWGKGKTHSISPRL